MAGASSLWVSNGLAWRSTLQLIRASLFANAVASLFLCKRVAASVSHRPKLNFVQLRGRMRMTLAAWMKSVRK